MADLAQFIVLEGSTFYFDTEVYTEGQPPLTIEYEDGDIVCWHWEGKRMRGTLRSTTHPGLFTIVKVKSA